MEVTSIKRGELFKALYENKISFSTREVGDDEILIVFVDLYGVQASMVLIYYLDDGSMNFCGFINKRPEEVSAHNQKGKALQPGMPGWEIVEEVFTDEGLHTFE